MDDPQVFLVVVAVPYHPLRFLYCCNFIAKACRLQARPHTTLHTPLQSTSNPVHSLRMIMIMTNTSHLSVLLIKHQYRRGRQKT